MKKFFELFFFLGLSFYSGIALAQQSSIIDQMLRIKPSLVEVTAVQTGWVKSHGHRGIGSIQNNGAGVMIHPSGIIVTNAHVVNQATHIKILLANGVKLNARILKFASNLDLALLKIDFPTALPSVTIADSGLINLNDDIFTVGNSPLLKEAITGGRITGLASSRNANYSNAYESDFFETSINLYKGDSGGPLFNRAGQLVGLVAAKMITKDHSSFAISSNKIRRYLDAVLKEMSEKP